MRPPPTTVGRTLSLYQLLEVLPLLFSLTVPISSQICNWLCRQVLISSRMPQNQFQNIYISPKVVWERGIVQMCVVILKVCRLFLQVCCNTQKCNILLASATKFLKVCCNPQKYFLQKYFLRKCLSPNYAIPALLP